MLRVSAVSKTASGLLGAEDSGDGPDLPGAHFSQDLIPGSISWKGVGSDGVWAPWQIPACINTV